MMFTLNPKNQNTRVAAGIAALGVTLASTTANAASVQNDSSGWQWATTTQFGSGDPSWPAFGQGSTKKSLEINKINDYNFTGSDGEEFEYRFGLNGAKRGGRMGAAIPWINIMNQFNGRTNYIDSIINTADGDYSDSTNVQNSCFLVQPINEFAINMQVPGIDNTDEIVWKANDGHQYVYLVAGYEGCGGDGWRGSHDVGNACSNSASATEQQAFVDNEKQAIEQVCSADASASTQPNQVDDVCQAFCSQYDESDGKWLPPSNQTDYVLKGSCPLGISGISNWGQNASAAVDHFAEMVKAEGGDYSHCATGHVNYCSGTNMHFDAASSSPIWTKDYTDMLLTNLNHDSSNQNIMVRWKAVPCDIWGKWDAAFQPCDAKFCKTCVKGNTMQCAVCNDGNPPSISNPDGTMSCPSPPKPACPSDCKGCFGNTRCYPWDEATCSRYPDYAWCGGN